MSRKLRTWFVGHPGAILFLLISARMSFSTATPVNSTYLFIEFHLEEVYVFNA